MVFSSADLTVLETFFDLSGLEEETKTETKDEPDNTTPTEQESE